MKLLNAAFLSSILSLGLLSCSNNSSNTPDEQPSNESKISEANATKVVDIAFNSFEQLDFLQDEVPGGSPAKTAEKGISSAQQLPVIFCGSDPFNDTGSGSMDISASGDLLSNFTLDIAFLQCQLTSSAFIDGAYNLSFSGDAFLGPQFPNGFSETRQTFTNLSISDTEQAFNGLTNGEIIATIEFDSPVLSTSESVNLLIAENNNEITFTNWEKNVSIDFSLGQLSLDVSGDIAISSENGSYSVATLEAIMFEFQQQNGSNQPNLLLSGRFIITAEDNSSVTVTILNNTDAQLEIDEDGDGTIDSTIVVPINDLSLFNSVN